jgi:D-3-phosphoglycerate dehydrogenase
MRDSPVPLKANSPRLSLAKDRIKILLLENVHANAVEAFTRAGYSSIERIGKALDEASLVKRIKGVHMLGIRSGTTLTPAVFEAANRLFAVGCFSVGTNQVDLAAARRAGVPVFNAPYSNTRSVAELVIGEAIMLLRGIPQRAIGAREGRWLKTAKGAVEARGKTIGIVGYGHIGSQVSVLAEALGMRVIYYDTTKKLMIGNARPCPSLHALLGEADVVTLHVPDTPQTRNMIDARALAAMKPGSVLINASRGTVVDIAALADALKRGHLKGAAIDVFPKEPAGEDEIFESPLRKFDNVILTPHIGGSTEEAQANIGQEVAEKLIEYSDTGSTVGAVNFVQVSLPVKAGGTRFLHIHRNVPGVLRRINEVFSSRSLNIGAQYLQTDPEMGYVVTEIDGAVDEADLRTELEAIEGTIRVRFLY